MPADRPRRGRPRDPRVDEAILDAYVALVGERGREALSREQVAGRAGVSVAAVYRRHGSMEDLQVAAASRPIGGSAPEPDTGSLRGDLRALLGSGAAAMRLPGATRALAEELAVMAGSERVRAAFSAFLDQRLGALAAVISRGVGRGELPADIDVDVLVDLLRGALYHRLLLRGRLPDEAMLDAVLDVVDGLRPRAAP